MGTGFAKKKKQAKMLQDQLLKMQSQMRDTDFVGTAGNGMVTITLTGEQEMKQIKIKPECVDPEDVEGLQDLIKAAYADAQKKIQSQTSNIPGMPDLSNLL
jgi:nucleoid-associated protein EbfC